MWEVWGLPPSSRMHSQLPWSAVMKRAPPMARVASAMRPTAASTASQATVAAARSPVWPIMSGLARLQTRRRYWPEWMASSRPRLTSGRLISGCRS